MALSEAAYLFRLGTTRCKSSRSAQGLLQLAFLLSTEMHLGLSPTSIASAAVLFSRTDVFKALERAGVVVVNHLIEDAVQANLDALGPNLLENGGFDSDTVWTYNGAPNNWSISGGVLNGVGSGTTTQIDQFGPDDFVTGDCFLVEFDLVEYTSGNVTVYIKGNATETVSTTPGRIRVAGYAGTSTLTGFRFSSSNFVGKIDNVSLRRIDLSKVRAWQDPAGTIPVMKMEDPLGLLLEKTGRGVDAVVDGGFAEGLTHWPATQPSAGIVEVVSSRLHINTTDGSFAGVTQSSLTVGKFYELSLDTEVVSGLGIQVTDSGPTVYLSAAATKVGHRVIFQATNANLQIKRTGGGNTDTYVDNISVKEIPGYHAIQPSSSTSKPKLSRRVNKFTGLTTHAEFGGVGWTNEGFTSAPDGTNTGIVIGFGASSYAVTTYPMVEVDASLCGTLWVKTLGPAVVTVRLQKGDGSERLNANLTFSTGVVNDGGGANSTSEEVSATPVGEGWYKIQIKGKLATTAYAGLFISAVSGSIAIWHPDLRLSSDVQGNPPYQAVRSDTDYDGSGLDAEGFAAHWKWDGVDDRMLIGPVDFSATDEISVVVSAALEQTATGAIVMELGPNIGTSEGAISIAGPSGVNTGTGNFGIRSKGTFYQAIDQSNGKPHQTQVLSMQSNISANSLIGYINGQLDMVNNGDQGTGNFSNETLYLGGRGTSTLAFKGRMYGITIVGKVLTDSQRKTIEAKHNRYARAY